MASHAKDWFRAERLKSEKFKIKEEFVKNKALKTAGVVFIVMALAQVIFGETQIPIWISAVAALVMIVLAVWMFKATSE